MTNSTTYQDQARRAIADADFRQCWPVNVRQTLVRAAFTEGELPAYAIRQVENALLPSISVWGATSRSEKPT
jgi:hypothetical protein